MLALSGNPSKIMALFSLSHKREKNSADQISQRRRVMTDVPGPKEIKISFPPEIQGGVYANNMVVSHTKEEFILDFIMVAPPTGTVTARVIVSPGHMKRVLEALRDNISKYEKSFGTIQIAEEPKGKIGFS